MKYLVAFTISFIILISTVAAVNTIVDPFAMYWSKALNQYSIKPESGTRARITKAYRAVDAEPDILIVGNSRVEMGLDPNHPAFAGKTVYNQGMPGAGLSMQIDYALHTMATSPTLEHVLVGVDYLDFLLTKQQLADLTKSSNISLATPSYQFRLAAQNNWYAQWQQYSEKLSLVLSLDALKASLTTLASQNKSSNTITAKGFNTAESYLAIIQHEGVEPLFKQKLSEINQRLQRQPKELLTSSSFPYSPNFAKFNKLVERAKSQNIKLTFFINPYHYSYLHTLADNQHWPLFKTWKSTLKQFFQHHNYAQLSFWDFSDFNLYVNEAVPLQTPKKAMSWYWEPAHYKKELGDLMLNTMLNQHTVKDFGLQLLPATVDQQQPLVTEPLSNREAWLELKAWLQIL